MGVADLLDPLIDSSFKGFPHSSPALRRSQIGAQGWIVLRGDLPLPLALPAPKQNAVQEDNADAYADAA